MVELAQILRRYWPLYEGQFGAQILPSHRRAVQCILDCRTPAMGGQVYGCARCQREHFVYHSCNHRACPKCGHGAATEWIDKQKRKLLPVPYYLITFTVPEALRPWLRSHQKLGYSLLLQQSAATLQDVARRQKYLGGELGFLSVLHTWGRQLQFHPHVHCVVAAGALSADGRRWRRPKSSEFFVPQIVLAARFRNRLKSAITDQPEAAQIPSQVWHQPWVVDVQSAGSGESALKYLSAYIYRTALSSQRILEDQNGQITFKYKDSEDGRWYRLTLSALEFLRRFLQHVLPKGFQRVRYYGWLSPAAIDRWNRVLALLDWKSGPPCAAVVRLPLLCPQCHQPMAHLGSLPRCRPP